MEEKASVLIVDDNISLRKTMSFVLEHKGYVVATAKDGAEAIGKVKEKPFEIILMDIKMSPMNGVEAYKRIKKVRPKAVVVMMTAYAVEDLVKEALKEGAYGIIYKPLDVEKMVALIERVREDKQGALILVVDDDPRTCITLKNILVKKGCKVRIVHTGEDAIAMVQKKAYDVIFIDVKLPTINGLETYLAIKKITPEVVAIMMTAYRQEMAELIEEALNSHAYTFLYKPLDMEEVLKVVDEICESRNRGRP